MSSGFDLRDELVSLIEPARVLTRRIDRIAWANDASVYRLVPRAVVLPRTVDEVRALLRFSRLRRIPLTFRAAGTSLSGQAVTDGILAVVSRHWRGIEIEEEGRLVRVQPGAIGGDVNRRLSRHGRKIGPDPASINSCMMGGILANNSSGMCCGVAQNAYHTLRSLHFLLPDGLELDTADPAAAGRLREEAPELARGLLELKRRVEADAELTALIRRKYGLKNTTGYSLNALLDFSEPLEILAHLMIGSEGTLGFLAEAVLQTVPDDPFRYTGLLFFADVPSACGTIARLKESGARALELMDRASLRSIESRPGVSGAIRELPPTAAALLVEYQCANEAELDSARRACDALLPELPLCAPAELTLDPERQAGLWLVRKGLIPSVGAMRRRGTSFIIEDVVFPPERLATGVGELQALFAEYGYDDAILFGHAKDGNLHFVLTQSFENPQDVERYDGFMRALARLVAGRHGGALKAEHGTGRNMAPFVEAEWGRAATEIHRAIKRLVDPEGLLNPDVLINDDPDAHVRHLKPLPTVEEEVDACIECGFCERLCPSRDLTLTPRQRIVVRREMARLRAEGSAENVLRELESDYRYDAIDTCATDGLCATGCPVGIDTGLLVKRLRRESHSALGRKVARLVAARFSLVERCARLALRLSGHAGRRAEEPAPETAPEVVCFPSCVTRVLGPAGKERPLEETIAEVARRAGAAIHLPADAAGLCCGLPFSSKGYEDAAALAANRTIESFWRWSRKGGLPIVVDSSPCSLALRESAARLTPRNRERLESMRLLDGIELAHDLLLPRLRPTPSGPGAVALHPVCSVVRLGARRQAGPAGRRLRGGRRDPGQRRLLRLRRRSRLQAAGADRRRDPCRGRGDPVALAAGLLQLEPHLRDRADPGDRAALALLLVPAGGGDPESMLRFGLAPRRRPADRSPMKATSIIAVLLALLLATPVLAERGVGGEAGLFAGVVFPDEAMVGESDPSPELAVGGRVGVVFHPRWTWFVDGTYAEIDTETGFGTADELTGRTGFELLLRPEKGWLGNLTLNAGLGWINFDYEMPGLDFDRPIGSAGIGQMIPWGATKRIRWEWRADVTLDDDGLQEEDVWQGRLLVGLMWGPPAAGSIATTTRSRDEDLDGVPDRKDACPGTPAGAIVDSRGCPIDSDRDGVPDGTDQCPDTPVGTQVDERGCLADSDRDGVPDGSDACPDTPAGALVDDWGCPLDSDRDGVPDGIDRCPGTPPGAIVDAEGCPRDSDGDGVPDGIDRCPNTPAGAEVDRNGCRVG